MTIKSRDESLLEYRSRISRALGFIQGHLAEDFSLDEVAAAACFSKYHFHRIFSALMGESLAEYIRRLRLERAANLLEKWPRMSVTEIALASGFSSPSVFSRDFSTRFGAPPSRWREDRRQGLAPLATGEPEHCDSTTEDLVARFASGEGPLTVRSLPRLRFASALHVGSYGVGIGEAWTRLCRWAGPRGLLRPGVQAAGVSWDNPEITAAGRCRYSACIAIEGNLLPSGEIAFLEFPARDYLILAYLGDETGFAGAYAELYRRFLPESGFEPEDSPAIEFYKKPPGLERRFDLEIAVPVHPLD